MYIYVYQTITLKLSHIYLSKKKLVNSTPKGLIKSKILLKVAYDTNFFAILNRLSLNCHL
jgi:hypothetical protein